MKDVATEPCKHCCGSGKVIPSGVLRDLRERSGLSLSALSRAEGISVTYLSDVERGTRAAGPRIQEIYRRLKKAKK